MKEEKHIISIMEQPDKTICIKISGNGNLLIDILASAFVKDPKLFKLFMVSANKMHSYLISDIANKDDIIKSSNIGDHLKKFL